MGKGKDGGAEFRIPCGAAACCCLVVLVGIGLAGLGIAKIVMGAIHLHDCSIEDLIPIWLIVSGLAPIPLFGFGRKNNEEWDSIWNLCATVCGVIGSFFYLSWLICGSVWIYPNYGKVTADDFNPCTGNITTGCTQGDCPKGLITFAFAMATIDWICMGCWIALIGCMICRACRGQQ